MERDYQHEQLAKQKQQDRFASTVVIGMDSAYIFNEIDREIERLQQVRLILIGIEGPRVAAFTKKKPTSAKSRMSEAGRVAVAAAQRKRWAEAKKGQNLA